VLVAVGTCIYLYVGEESLKVFTASALVAIFGFLWHYGKSGARLGKSGGVIMT